MEILVALFFLVALCVGHKALDGYKLPLYKKFIGISLIVFSVLNLGWDCFLAEKKYDNAQQVDTDLIAMRLEGIKKFPNLKDLDRFSYHNWRRDNQEYLSEYSLYDQMNKLYVTQKIVDVYGQDVAREHSYEQCCSMLRDTIQKYNSEYIDKIFTECLSPYDFSGNFNPKKGLGNDWQKYSKASLKTKLSILRKYAGRNSIPNPSDVLKFDRRRAFCVFILILGWGIYILLTKPMYSPIWKLIVKCILYILISISIFGVSHSDEFTRLLGIGIEFVSMALLIWLNLSGERKTEQNNQKQTKNKPIDYKRVILKIILSFVMIVYCISSLSFIDEGDGLTVFGIIFYIPCFVVLVAFYLYLLWRRQQISGSDILLLPLLQRVKLFKSYSNTTDEKKALTQTTLPFILSMIICPMLTSILYFNVRYNEPEELGWLIIFLFIPPILLLAGLATGFSKYWINKSN